ncbi:hypothetical protein [Clostridium sp. BJN0001]|uniref:hypothetical protein n=1 Tax=Clostridium sp. BJN0001 TaxID=2930219 RepID=UPI001FD0F4AD|nr:hypothetical protein [Clostridium sp. BJN0001]
MSNKIRLNINFKGDKVICAKSPELCKKCVQKNECEKLDLFYKKYTKRDVIECFHNSEKRR